MSRTSFTLRSARQRLWKSCHRCSSSHGGLWATYLVRENQGDMLWSMFLLSVLVPEGCETVQCAISLRCETVESNFPLMRIRIGPSKSRSARFRGWALIVTKGSPVHP